MGGVSPGEALSDSARSNKLATYVRAQMRTRWNQAALGGKKVKVNSVGFFYESPEVGAFLWALSRENSGSFVGMSRP